MSLRQFFASLALIFAIAVPAAASKQDEQPKNGEQFATLTERNDPELLAAAAKARATLPEWLNVLASGSPDVGGIQFRFPLGGFEHIWVENVERNGDMLIGTLVMQPKQDGFARGDRVEVPLSDVNDWGYWTRDNVAHGFHSYPVLFSRMDRARANELRRQLGWPEE